MRGSHGPVKQGIRKIAGRKSTERKTQGKRAKLLKRKGMKMNALHWLGKKGGRQKGQQRQWKKRLMGIGLPRMEKGEKPGM